MRRTPGRRLPNDGGSHEIAGAGPAPLLGVMRILGPYVPRLQDPIGLVRRIVRSKDPAARFAVYAAAAGVVASPLDLLLAVRERRLYARSNRPTKPVLVVCGPPRSGTTLVAQTLIRHLPVAYINNLTSLFPRAPITSNQLFGRWIRRRASGFRSYYGRTAGLAGPNDALYLWDRWLGTNRDRLKTSLGPAQRDAMLRFFAAFEAFTGKPVVLKNNSLNTCAALVADVLDNAIFLCLERKPAMLAQSLLLARDDIHGDSSVPYGVGPTELADADPVISVCRQVQFHRRSAAEQRERVGHGRFWIVSYEEFCSEPSTLVQRVSREILGSASPLAEPIEPFQISAGLRIGARRFRQIEATLDRMGI